MNFNLQIARTLLLFAVLLLQIDERNLHNFLEEHEQLLLFGDRTTGKCGTYFIRHRYVSIATLELMTNLSSNGVLIVLTHLPVIGGVFWLGLRAPFLAQPFRQHKWSFSSCCFSVAVQTTSRIARVSLSRVQVHAYWAKSVVDTPRVPQPAKNYGLLINFFATVLKRFAKRRRRKNTIVSHISMLTNCFPDDFKIVNVRQRKRESRSTPGSGFLQFNLSDGRGKCPQTLQYALRCRPSSTCSVVPQWRIKCATLAFHFREQFCFAIAKVRHFDRWIICFHRKLR